MSSDKIGEKWAWKIYALLMKHAGQVADIIESHEFVRAQTEGCREYRLFCTKLGSGAKFWNTGDKWYVNMYEECERPEHGPVMETVNAELAKLRRESMRFDGTRSEAIVDFLDKGGEMRLGVGSTGNYRHVTVTGMVYPFNEAWRDSYSLSRAMFVDEAKRSASFGEELIDHMGTIAAKLLDAVNEAESNEVEP